VKAATSPPFCATRRCPADPTWFSPTRACNAPLVTPEWKLIRYPKVGEIQLFDLRADPHETNDLAEVSAQAGRLSTLAEQLTTRLAEAGDNRAGRNDDAP
jgi:hypothetical protein